MTILMLLLASGLSAATSLSNGVSCGNNGITWNGSTYTCTDHDFTTFGPTYDYGPSTGTLAVRLNNVAVATTTLGAETINTSRIDLSTITTALAGKQSTTAAVPTANLDFSTLTTALAGKQASNAHLDDLADGSLTASKVASGYSGANISGAVATATSLAADGANCAGGEAPLGVDASGAVQGCFAPGAGSEGNTYASSKTFTSNVLAKSSVSASSYYVQGSSVNTVFGMMKRAVAADQVFYAQVTSPVTGLDFPLARNTSYYFEYDIIHQSTATATGIWFGMNFPTGSTITWKSTQMISLVAVTTNMSRGQAFTTASGASVDVANANLYARIVGTITTATAGNLQPIIKTELATGRGVVKVGSSGRLHEQ